MCGLVAYLKTSDRPLDPRVIEAMTHAMEHRGPDDFGMCFVGREGPVCWRNAHNAPDLSEKGVAMGHRRMSVFDLTEAGRQPFLSPDGRFAMVFNGEIYNYVELRNELSQHGLRFSTDCDSEVLLAAFEKWGTDCFNRLNGSWAVVIWDNLTKELVVGRDRLGEKPLMYAQVDGDWVFASEMKALLQHPKIHAEPNERSLERFIAAGWGPAGEETFFAGIKSLEPATFLTFRDGNVTKTKFWDLNEISLPPPSDDARAVHHLDELLTDAVRLRLRADIRVGSMLSGGLDSTSVISCIAKLLASRPGESRTVGDTLQAFTASFPGMRDDESDKVEELCRQIEIDTFRTFPATQGDIEERLKQAARSMEGPFFSPAILVYDMLMGLARSSEVPIVLDGLGGDELFGGFDWYIPLAARDAFKSFRIREAFGHINGMRSKHGKSRWDAIKSASSAGTWSSVPPTDEYFDHALKVDLLKHNAPRWLHMCDRISMANSVVSRSPFLDYRIVEFAFSLKNNLKIRNAETKYILREAMRNVLPASIVNDHKKIQLSGPGPMWLKGPLKQFVLSLREEKESRLSTVLNGRSLRTDIDLFFAKKADSRRTWRIASAEAFLRAYS